MTEPRGEDDRSGRAARGAHDGSGARQRLARPPRRRARHNARRVGGARPRGRPRARRRCVRAPRQGQPRARQGEPRAPRGRPPVRPCLYLAFLPAHDAREHAFMCVDDCIAYRTRPVVILDGQQLCKSCVDASIDCRCTNSQLLAWAEAASEALSDWWRPSRWRDDIGAGQITRPPIRHGATARHAPAVAGPVSYAILCQLTPACR